MAHWAGMMMQFVVLAFLPLLIIWQLNFGFPVGYMAGCTLVGVVVFVIGTKLRES